MHRNEKLAQNMVESLTEYDYKELPYPLRALLEVWTYKFLNWSDPPIVPGEYEVLDNKVQELLKKDN